VLNDPNKIRAKCITYLKDHKEDLTRFFYNRAHFFDFLAHLRVFLIFFVILSPIIKKSCYFKSFIEFAESATEIVTYDGYIAEMSQPTCWGGEIEVQALSKAYEVNVVVHQPGTYDNLVLDMAKLKLEEETKSATTLGGLGGLKGGPKKKKGMAFLTDEEKKKKEEEERLAKEEAERKENEKWSEKFESVSDAMRFAGTRIDDAETRSAKKNFLIHEKINFDSKTAPCIQLSYHPDHHAGKHYNAVAFESDEVALKPTEKRPVRTAVDVAGEIQKGRREYLRKEEV